MNDNDEANIYTDKLMKAQARLALANTALDAADLCDDWMLSYHCEHGERPCVPGCEGVAHRYSDDYRAKSNEFRKAMGA